MKRARPPSLALPEFSPDTARRLLLTALGVELEPAPEPEAEKPALPEQQEKPAIPRLAFTIDEFCKAHGIGRSTFYRLMDRGEGPDMMKIGDSHRISAEAAKRWRRSREQNRLVGSGHG